MKEARPFAILNAATAALILLIAGCGGDSSSGPAPTPVPTPSPAAVCTQPQGGTIGLTAAGLYVFNSRPGVAAPEIQEFTADLSAGAVTQTGTVATGAGLYNLIFTANGAFAYGLDANGNLWGYKVNPANGELTSLGMVASGLPGSLPNSASETTLQMYGSVTLWVINSVSSGNNPATIEEFPINLDGTLGSATSIALFGYAFRQFLLSSNQANALPTALWADGQNPGGGIFGPRFTLRVYPVNTSGMVSGTSIQTTNLFSPLQLASPPATFADSLAFPFGPLETFFTAADGTITPVSSVSLPPTGSSGYGGLGPVPGYGGTIGFWDGHFNNALVFPVSSTGVLGSVMYANLPCGGSSRCSPQVPLGSKVAGISNPVPPSPAPLPSVWMIPKGYESGAITPGVINEFTVNSNGSINSSPTATVTAPAGMGNLVPSQGPYSYGISGAGGGIDFTGNIYGYSVSSSGALTALGSFVGPSISGFELEGVAPFPPESFTNAPVALMAEKYNEDFFPPFLSQDGGSVTIYSLCAQGMPSSTTPLGVVTVPFGAAETYLVLTNGSVLTGKF